MSDSRPIGEHLFTWPSDDPQLIGGQCGGCAAVTFPHQYRCPRCGQDSMAELLLPREGTLASWTTQGFPPVVPYAGGGEFVPFGVGLVRLGDLVHVEARLTESDPAKLDFGMPVKLAVVPFYTEPDGTEVVTFAFAPTGA